MDPLRPRAQRGGDRIVLATSREAEAILSEFDGHVFSASRYSVSDSVACAIPTVRIEPLTDISCEIWLSARPLETFLDDGIEVVRGRDGRSSVRLSVEEEEIVGAEGHPLAVAAFQAYRSLFRAVEVHGLGHIIRLWNYIPAIVEHVPGAEIAPVDRERYRQFNIGRWRAFEQFGSRDAKGALRRPAATGIGSTFGPLVVTAITSTADYVSIENPRQVPAYSYPSRYGTSPPSFARAALSTSGDQTSLYLSGTASIVGCDTVHLGDPVEQVHETFRNINALIGMENMRRYGHDGFELSDFSYLRVYLKRAEDYDIVRRTVESIVGGATPVCYLRQDVCRPDLLCEIEGVASLAP
jgi:chorismate lyase / 3-hydroxybenzoate synthase